MMNFENFLLGLLISSTLTGLVTEAIKKILTEYNVNYRANTLAGIVAFVLSAAIGIGYMIMFSIAFTAQTIIALIALAFMSWLGAMVGYDKLVQAIGQFKTGGKE